MHLSSSGDISTISRYAVSNFDVGFFSPANFDSCFVGNYFGIDLVGLALK